MASKIQKRKVCFIIPYFGAPQSWFRYFFKSVSKNVNYDWLFISDFKLKQILPGNVKFVYMSMDEFKILVFQKTGIQPIINEPYKLCDFKPAYGHLFSDYIISYDYWGYCDTDILIGDLDYFLSKKLNKKYDVISPDPNFFPGHFCVFRNVDKIKYLYQLSDNYKLVFESSKCFYFDEFLIQRGIKATSAKRKWLVAKLKIRNTLFKKIVKNKAFRIFKSMFINRTLNKNHHIKFKDFNSVLLELKERGEISAYVDKMHYSDFSNRIKKNNLKWDNGKLFYNDEEILYYHFQISKKEGLHIIENEGN